MLWFQFQVHCISPDYERSFSVPLFDIFPQFYAIGFKHAYSIIFLKLGGYECPLTSFASCFDELYELPGNYPLVMSIT